MGGNGRQRLDHEHPPDLIPEHLFGRVQGAWRTIVWGAMPAGALGGGALARVAGLRAPFLVESAAFVIVLVAAWSLLRNLGDAEPMQTTATHSST